MKNICISPKKSYWSSSIGATLNSYYGVAKWHKICAQCVISKYNILIHWLQTC